MYSPETQARVDQLRRKAAEGTYDEADVAEACKLLRAERLSAVQTSAKKRSSAKAKVKNADDLLDELNKI